MRILIVTPIFPPEIGGPATYVPDLINKLVPLHQVTVITFCSQKPNQLPKAKVVWIPTTSNAVVRQLKLFLVVLYKSLFHDLVYIQGPLVVGLMANLAAKFTSKPTVIKYVGDEVWEASRITKTMLTPNFVSQLPIKFKLMYELEKFTLKTCDQIVTPSNYLKGIIVSLFNLEDHKINVIHNAVEVPKIAVKRNPHQLISIGRLVSWKNFDEVIKAVAIARKRHHWKLVIVGSGPEEKSIKSLIKKIKAESWVQLTGQLNRLDTLKQIAKSQKLILFSDYEGLSHTLIEAMCLGTKIVASDIPPNKEVIFDKAVYAPLHNEKELAAAINSKANFATTHQHANDLYNWMNHTKKLIEVFTKII